MAKGRSTKIVSMIKWIWTSRSSRKNFLVGVDHLLGASDRRGSFQKGNGLHPKPTLYILHPTPYTLHHAPCTLHPTPFSLNPTPYTLLPQPYTLHLSPYTLNPETQPMNARL